MRERAARGRAIQGHLRAEENRAVRDRDRRASGNRESGSEDLTAGGEFVGLPLRSQETTMLWTDVGFLAKANQLVLGVVRAGDSRFLGPRGKSI